MVPHGARFRTESGQVVDPDRPLRRTISGMGEDFHLELTPAQMKITHTALRSLLDDFGHEEAEVHRIIHEVLEKLPDEHAIRVIELSEDGGEPA